MRRMSVLLIAAFLLSAIPSFAREYARFEFFGGYNLVNVGDYYDLPVFPLTPMPGPSGPIFGQEVSSQSLVSVVSAREFMGARNGWNMAFTGNLNSVFGIKGEIAGIYKNTTLYDGKINAHSFMAGPQINGRFEAFPGTLFGHALFGTVRDKVSFKSAGVEGFGSAFAMALGGGIDWGKGRVGFRAPQIDYFTWRASGGLWVDSDSNMVSNMELNNVRVSAGIVIRFGN